MERISAIAVATVAVLLLPLTAQAQQSSGGGKGTTAKPDSARQAALQQCRQMHSRTGRGAADNTAILMEQCMKDKLGKK